MFTPQKVKVRAGDTFGQGRSHGIFFYRKTFAVCPFDAELKSSSMTFGSEMPISDSFGSKRRENGIRTFPGRLRYGERTRSGPGLVKLCTDHHRRRWRVPRKGDETIRDDCRGASAYRSRPGFMLAQKVKVREETRLVLGRSRRRILAPTVNFYRRTFPIGAFEPRKKVVSGVPGKFSRYRTPSVRNLARAAA